MPSYCTGIYTARFSDVERALDAWVHSSQGCIVDFREWYAATRSTDAVAALPQLNHVVVKRYWQWLEIEDITFIEFIQLGASTSQSAAVRDAHATMTAWWTRHGAAVTRSPTLTSIPAALDRLRLDDVDVTTSGRDAVVDFDARAPGTMLFRPIDDVTPSRTVCGVATRVDIIDAETAAVAAAAAAKSPSPVLLDDTAYGGDVDDSFLSDVGAPDTGSVTDTETASYTDDASGVSVASATHIESRDLTRDLEHAMRATEPMYDFAAAPDSLREFALRVADTLEQRTRTLIGDRRVDTGELTDFDVMLGIAAVVGIEEERLRDVVDSSRTVDTLVTSHADRILRFVASLRARFGTPQ